jgi:prepilin-type N-terminal cleavage/methylation domain-containing protein
MKLLSSIASPRWPLRSGQTAFTLTEFMVAMSIFALVIFAVIYSQMFGMKMFTMTQSKLTASNGARKVLNRIRDEIRSGKTMVVGNGDANSFSIILSNAPVVGNALQIYPTTATNTFVRYYLDLSDQKLKRQTSGSNQLEVLASYITNQIVFRAEDYAGNVLTNEQNNRVIKMTLQFYQWEFPVMVAGQGGYYDYYKLQTRMTRRTIE